mmetsp:Transcript_92982/g.225836  ORF Transcript_92982/g.225836 Transcript_92982/m.225836 type:complete len:203 (-) Transcript_92982:800-1408(-)
MSYEVPPPVARWSLATSTQPASQSSWAAYTGPPEGPSNRDSPASGRAALELAGATPLALSTRGNVAEVTRQTRTVPTMTRQLTAAGTTKKPARSICTPKKNVIAAMPYLSVYTCRNSMPVTMKSSGRRSEASTEEVSARNWLGISSIFVRVTSTSRLRPKRATMPATGPSMVRVTWSFLTTKRLPARSYEGVNLAPRHRCRQ